jgi:hypothetical protein
MFTSALLLAAAFAQDLSIAVDGNPTPGATITVTIDGLTPGEPAFLATSTELGETCPGATAPHCSDLVRPRVLARGAPSGSTVVVDVTVPNQEATHYLQAISPSGVSDVHTLESVALDPVDPSLMPPLVVGVAVMCDTDQVDLIAQYMGDADHVQARAYLGGVMVVDQPLNQEPAPAGSIFFDATAFGAEAPTCGDLTWVVEAENPNITTCVVRGAEASALRDGGTIASDCANI